MYIQVQNGNYGYATATHGEYVCVGNPDFARYTGSSPTTYHSGSIDYYKYNKSTDRHDLIKTLYLHSSITDILLARETGSDSSVRDPLHTELGSIFSANKDLLIDQSSLINTLEDGMGISLDMYNTFLVAGIPYYTVNFATDYLSLSATGSQVEIYDFSLTSSDPWCYTIQNPHAWITESFGVGVGINDDWIAIGSPYASASMGIVYLYKNNSVAGGYTWSFHQIISSSDIISGQQFGRSVKLNKQIGSYSGSMIVGCGLTSSNKAYYYEFISGSWRHTYTFNPTSDIYPLTFGNYPPYQPTMSVNSAYGYDVSLFDTTVIVGAYADRIVGEYTGSAQYNQGAVYIYERCPSTGSSRDFRLALKTYGPPRILKNNRLGISVDVQNTYALAGSPRVDMDRMTPCYIQNTLDHLFNCGLDDEYGINGQAVLLQKNTSSLDWEIINVFQNRKRFLAPHRVYGFDVSIDGFSMVVGAPLNVSGIVKIELETTKSAGVEVDDVAGKAYIYNLHNLRPDFHVGNVFYRNGKIVLMTSGSSFNGLFLNPASSTPYQYDLKFKGERTIHEKQIVCTVDPGEFNVSTNPTSTVYITSSLDLNKNGVFDFQDIDVLLRYMQYKIDGSTDWSSSILEADDEISFYNYNFEQWQNTGTIYTSSFNRFENVEPTYLHTLDVNDDGRSDSADMALIWKYFSNRLTDKNFSQYVNVNTRRPILSQVLQYLDSISKRKHNPQILPAFFDYDTLSISDKTGSFLAPMVTTIGLYDGLDLVAVAKLGSPIKLPKTIPINFVIKMDF